MEIPAVPLSFSRTIVILEYRLGQYQADLNHLVEFCQKALFSNNGPSGAAPIRVAFRLKSRRGLPPSKAGEGWVGALGAAPTPARSRRRSRARVRSRGCSRSSAA